MKGERKREPIWYNEDMGGEKSAEELKSAEFSEKVRRLRMSVCEELS